MGGSGPTGDAFGGQLPPGITGTNERTTLLATNINSEVYRYNFHSIVGEMQLNSHMLKSEYHSKLMQTNYSISFPIMGTSCA